MAGAPGLPWGITPGGSAEWRRTGFDSTLTLSGKPRRDRTLSGFSPRFSLVQEQRESCELQARGRGNRASCVCSDVAPFSAVTPAIVQRFCPPT